MLIAATVIALYLCFLIVKPFIVSLVWAVTLAVLTFPVYRRIQNYLGKPNLSAALMTFFLATVVAAPLILVTRQVLREVWRGAEYVQKEAAAGEWRAQIEQNYYVSRALRFIEREVDLRANLEQAAGGIPAFVSDLLSGSLWFLFQMLVAFFALFFFFRDHEKFLRGVRLLVPLSRKETDAIFRRVSDTLYAAVFGEILIAALQGVLGGLMFWFLGLPAPVLWGFVIGLFGFLPVIGAWMIWAPAAVYLFMQGEVVKGFVLIGWGILALTVLTTFLYPVLVGDRLRLHTLTVFIAIIGGIIAFGTTGIVLGPLVLALTISLIDIWKKRIGAGEQLAEEPVLEES